MGGSPARMAGGKLSKKEMMKIKQEALASDERPPDSPKRNPPPGQITRDRKRARVVVDVFKEFQGVIKELGDTFAAFGAWYVEAEQERERKQKKTKGKKNKTDKEKKPPTAFNMYIKETLAKLKEKHSELPHKQLFSMAAASWADSDQNPKNKTRDKVVEKDKKKQEKSDSDSDDTDDEDSGSESD